MATINSSPPFFYTHVTSPLRGRIYSTVPLNLGWPVVVWPPEYGSRGHRASFRPRLLEDQQFPLHHFWRLGLPCRNPRLSVGERGHLEEQLTGKEECWTSGPAKSPEDVNPSCYLTATAGETQSRSSPVELIQFVLSPWAVGDYYAVIAIRHFQMMKCLWRNKAG